MRTGVANNEVEDTIQVGQVIKLDLEPAWETSLALNNSYLCRQSSPEFYFGSSNIRVSTFRNRLAWVPVSLLAQVPHPPFRLAYRPVVFDNFLRKPSLGNGIL